MLKAELDTVAWHNERHLEQMELALKRSGDAIWETWLAIGLAFGFQQRYAVRLTRMQLLCCFCELLL